MQRFDVLIIGSGLAAVTLALSLPRSLRIAMITKKSAQDSASAWAQGGIAAVMGKEDALADHVRDTLVAGAGLSDEAGPQGQASPRSKRPRGDDWWNRGGAGRF